MNNNFTDILKNELKYKDFLIYCIEKLAGQIGERNYIEYKNLALSADFLEETFTKSGYMVNRQPFMAKEKTFYNLEVEIPGSKNPDEIIIIGAHYDSAIGTKGANDNASGVAAVAALANNFAGKKPSRTLRFVQFTNEEPPFFMTNNMGSLVYARQCQKKGEKIKAMLSLETIGYYSDNKNSQKYPFPLSFFYPHTGNFIGFVGNIFSGKLIKQAVSSFSSNTKFPCVGISLPGMIPGVGWSDHWSFWKAGYPAIMVTDTALFRYSYYHKIDDTPDKIIYDKMANVVFGIEGVINNIAGISKDEI